MSKIGRFGFFLQLIGMPICFLISASLTPHSGLMTGLAVLIYGSIGWMVLGIIGIILGVLEIRSANIYSLECKSFGVDPPVFTQTFAILSIVAGSIPPFIVAWLIL